MPNHLLVSIVLSLSGVVVAGDTRWTVETAIQAVESDTERYDAKRSAIKFLRESTATEVVPRLGVALNGRYDVTELEILNALADLKDAKALPYLEAYEKRIAGEFAYVSGKINGALIRAKKECASK
jgi:hypothetical protein